MIAYLIFIIIYRNGSSSSTSMITHRLDHLSLNTSCNNGDQPRQSTVSLIFFFNFV